MSPPADAPQLTGGSDSAPEHGPLVVYWRPACGFCARLLRMLDDASIVPELHNIWQDDGARDFVRAHNGGNETVPTVLIAGEVLTNPDPAALIAVIAAHHPHLIQSP